MSSGSDGAQQGGFDFKSIVSWVALIAAGGGLLYTSSVDNRDQVSDLEGSIVSLTSRINERPDADAVRNIITETVQIPEAGPSVGDVQALIDAPLAELRTEVASLGADMTSLNNDLTGLGEDVSGLNATMDGQVGDLRSELATLGSNFEAEFGEIRNALGAAVTAEEARTLAEQAATSANDAIMADQVPQLIAANAIPKGAVVAFATSCPTDLGWKEHEDSRGRFLVSSGSGTDANGEERTFVLGIGTDDGEYAHTLTESEMPLHRHAVDRQGPTRGIQDVPALGAEGAIIATIETELTHPAGGDEAHNNLPPYFALHFCEKL